MERAIHQTRLKSAALFIGVSGVLHALAPLVVGMQPEALRLLPIAAFYALLIAGLLRPIGWLAYLAFICMLVGSIGAYIELEKSGPLPDWLLMGIIAADLLAAAALFIHVWRRP